MTKPYKNDYYVSVSDDLDLILGNNVCDCCNKEDVCTIRLQGSWTFENRIYLCEECSNLVFNKMKEIWNNCR